MTNFNPGDIGGGPSTPVLRRVWSSPPRTTLHSTWDQHAPRARVAPLVQELVSSNTSSCAKYQQSLDFRSIACVTNLFLIYLFGYSW